MTHHKLTLFLSFFRALVLWLVFGVTAVIASETIIHSTRLSLFNNPKYAENFTHFDYVNPAAPKGGSITLSAIGTFDNFNIYASRGVPVVNGSLLFDTLFYAAEDEVSVYYPLIARSIRYPNHFQWAEVTLNPDARFSDGRPITAEDVAFSFNKLMTEGVPQFRRYYNGITATALTQQTVRFEFPASNKSRFIGVITGIPIFPKHYWQNINLAEPLSTPPQGSSVYSITQYKLGQYAIYERNPHYWAQDLPVNRGRYNLDAIRYDYYLNDNVALEAFKSGYVDLRVEKLPKNWASFYSGAQFDQGNIKKIAREVQSAQNSVWLAFNVQRSLFQDRKVREALSLALDFEWQNKALYYDAYVRTRSFFQNTPYEATALPDEQERRWLTPLKDQIPDEVFDRIYQPPRSDGNGFNRQNLLRAARLLADAGWVIRDNQLVNANSGKPFEFELLLPFSAQTEYVLNFKQNLQMLGIKLTITSIDNSQFLSRLRKRDYDMVPSNQYANDYPAASLAIIWSSAYLDSSYNTPGIADPAIDYLIAEIEKHQSEPETLLSLGRALDRVLTWQYLMIPRGQDRYSYYAYWNTFDFPAVYPRYALGLSTWWQKSDQAHNTVTAGEK